jgi:F-type H+-transporting ATPase subunit b
LEKLISDFSFGLFFWQSILFIALLLLLKKFAWKPILDAVNEREASINDSLKAAERARQEMKNLQADNEKILNEARAERERIVKEATDMKNKIVSDASDLAKVEANKMIESARAQIDAEKQSAISQIKTQVAELSVEIAEKLLRKELAEESKQQKLIDALLDDAKL